MVRWEVLEDCLVGSKAGGGGGGQGQGRGRGLSVVSAGASRLRERDPAGPQPPAPPAAACPGASAEVCLALLFPAHPAGRQDLAQTEPGQLLGWPNRHLLYCLCH